MTSSKPKMQKLYVDSIQDVRRDEGRRLVRGGGWRCPGSWGRCKSIKEPRTRLFLVSGFLGLLVLGDEFPPIVKKRSS